MGIWSLLLPATCPLSLSLLPSSTRIDFRQVSFSSSIVYPTLSVKSANYNVQIVVENDDEPEEELIHRFRKEVIRARVFQECRRRRFFETPQDKIKRKAREASRRNRKRRPYSRIPEQNWYDSPNKEKDNDDDDEEEDNRELFDVDLPYS